MRHRLLTCLLAILVICCVVALTLCLHHRRAPNNPSWTPAPEGTFARQIAKLESADVRADVEAALAKGDQRLMEVGTDAGVVPPGVPDFMPRREMYLKNYGVRWIDNTSDVIASPEQGRLQGVAWRYAERYNKLLLERTRPASRPMTRMSTPEKQR